MGNEALSSEIFSWQPETVAPIVSDLKYLDTTDASDHAIATFEMPANGFYDITATVMARCDGVGHFAVDLRAAYERHGGGPTYTTIRSPGITSPLAGNPATWTATISRSGDTISIFVNSDGDDARWSCAYNVQCIKDGTPFLISDLSLDLFVEADYEGGTWTGRDSAGTSLGHDMVAGAGGAPTSGGAVNSRIPADFVAANTQSLVQPSGHYATEHLSTTALYLAAVFNSRSAPAHSTVAADPGIVGEVNGGFGLTFSSSGVKAHILEPGDTHQVTASCTDNAWHFAEMWFSTSDNKLHLAVDGVESGTGTTLTSPSYIASNLSAWQTQIGKSYSGYFDGRIQAVYGSKTVLDGTARANLLARAKARFSF